MKLNSKVDDIRFKGRKNMGEARNTSRQSGHKNRDTGRMERMWKWPGLKRYALSSPAPGRAEDTAVTGSGAGVSPPSGAEVSESSLLSVSRFVPGLGDHSCPLSNTNPMQQGKTEALSHRYSQPRSCHPGGKPCSTHRPWRRVPTAAQSPSLPGSAVTAMEKIFTVGEVVRLLLTRPRRLSLGESSEGWVSVHQASLSW